MMNMMGSMGSGSHSSSHFDINSPEFGGSSSGSGGGMGGPLSQLSESVNKMDPLVAMEKSLSMNNNNNNNSNNNNNHQQQTPHMGPPPLTTSPPSTSPVVASTSTSHAGASPPSMGGAPSSCGGSIPTISTPQVIYVNLTFTCIPMFSITVWNITTVKHICSTVVILLFVSLMVLIIKFDLFLVM